MSSSSPGALSKLVPMKALLDSADALLSEQNWSASISELNSITDDLSYDDGNFTISFNTTAPYETAMVQEISPMYVYFTPCLIALGMTGNILSIYVFCKSIKLRQQSSSQYLSALAVSDSIFLLQLLPAWLTTMGIDNVFFGQDTCRFFVYFSYVTCTLSSWLVLAFTIERCIAVLYPLQHAAMCTVRRARCIILALTITSLLVNIPVLNFAGTGGVDCGVSTENMKVAEQFNWVDTLIVFTLPLLAILGVNIWIVITLLKFGRMRLKLLNEGREQDSSKCGDLDYIFPRLQRRITNMLLLVSSVFFVFNVPAYVMRVFAYSYDWETSENSDTLMAIHIVAMVLFYSTFGINFFLYCLSGQNFRRALMQHVPCFGWLAGQCGRLTRRNRPNAARAPSPTISAASNGTDATCNVNSGGKKSKRPRPNIYRKKFGSRWRRNTSATTRTESIEMQEIAPRPGPSREPEQSAQAEPIASTSYALTTQRSTVSRRITLSRVVTPEENALHLSRLSRDTTDIFSMDSRNDGLLPQKATRT